MDENSERPLLPAAEAQKKKVESGPSNLTARGLIESLKGGREIVKFEIPNLYRLMAKAGRRTATVALSFPKEAEITAINLTDLVPGCKSLSPVEMPVPAKGVITMTGEKVINTINRQREEQGLPPIPEEIKKLSQGVRFSLERGRDGITNFSFTRCGFQVRDPNDNTLYHPDWGQFTIKRESTGNIPVEERVYIKGKPPIVLESFEIQAIQSVPEEEEPPQESDLVGEQIASAVKELMPKLSRLLGPGRKKVGKRLIEAATASGMGAVMSLVVACGRGTPAATPTPVKPPLTQIPPEQQPTAPPTIPTIMVDTESIKDKEEPVVTKDKLPTVQLGGVIETIDERSDRMRLFLPETVTGGENPLVPKGETAMVVLELGNDDNIASVIGTDLLGLPRRGAYRGGNLSIPEEGQLVSMTGKEMLENLINGWRANKMEIPQFNPTALEIIGKFRIALFRSKGGEVTIALNIPNQPYSYTDSQGTHLIDPLTSIILEFSKKLASANPPSLTGKGYIDVPGKGRVAEIDEFTLAPPRVINVKSDHRDKSEITVVVKDSEGGSLTGPSENKKVIEVKSGLTKPEESVEPGKRAEQRQRKTNDPLEEKWTNKEWAPDEEVSVAEWWEDMVNRGLIKIDSLARQYAGAEIDRLVSGSKLVPNPQEYYKKGHPFIGNCVSTLKELAASSQGHIIIDPQVYQFIPGGEECQLYASGK